jgi:hypothetical protein
MPTAEVWFLVSRLASVFMVVFFRRKTNLKTAKPPSRFTNRARTTFENVTLILRDDGITTIRDCAIPQLLGYDDELLIIEMTVVTRPYVLDFGGAFLDQPPGFSKEILAEWQAEKQEQFGKRWPDVQAILGILEGYGIFVVDVNPNNISWPD